MTKMTDPVDVQRAIEVKEYAAETAPQKVERFLISCVADYVIPRLRGKEAIELGIGHGSWTALLLRQFDRVTTIERAPELIESLRPNVDAARWTPVCCSFEDYAPDRKVDSIVATYVLEHVPDPEALLTRMREWIRPGGQIAIVVPNALSIHRRLAVQMGMIRDPAELGEADRKVGHCHCFAPAGMAAIIAGAGYRIVEQCGLLAKSLPSKYLVDCTEQQLRGLFDVGRELPVDFSAILYYLAEPRGRA
jgi:protein-L-isoaspartate O-methyltransferase